MREPKTRAEAPKAYRPPAAVASQAARGLDLRSQFGRGGTEVNVVRARGLKERHAVDVATLKKIRAYFARHNVDKRGKNWGSKDNPSAGFIAWLLWGGDPARDWVERELARHDAKA